MLPLNVIHILTNGFGFNKLDIIMNTYGTNNSGGENLHASFSDFIIGDKVSHLKFKKFKVHHFLVKIPNLKILLLKAADFLQSNQIYY